MRSAQTDLIVCMMLASMAKAGAPTLLEKWFKSVVSSDDRRTLRELLLAERGTIIEPFNLSEQNLLLAERFTGICFSLGEKRVRVVGDSSPNDRGGIVIGANFKTHLAHNFPFARPRNISPSTAWIQPKLLSTDVSRFLRPGPATVQISESGPILKIPMPKGVDYSEEPRASLGRTGQDVRRLNWSVGWKRHSIIIRPQTPESSIKFLVACATEESIDIIVDLTESGSLEINVTLGTLNEDYPAIVPSRIALNSHPILACCHIPQLSGMSVYVNNSFEGLEDRCILPSGYI